MSGEVVIEARGLRKSFNGHPALKDVSFAAHRGELLAVIGPNGAGKTTLLSILAGIRSADDGSVSRGHGDLGWVPQQPALYRRLTVAENLRLFAHLEGIADPGSSVEEMLELTGLGDRRDDQVATLSGGNQQRVNIAIGLLARPAVLLLDEPSSGLDPRQRERLWEFVQGLATGGTTVVFSTHYIQEAERYGDRLLVLADGERVFEGTSRELHEAVQEPRAAPSASDQPVPEHPVSRPGAPGARDFEEAFVFFLRDRGH